jgi:GNAT superfamily N-acetyltransferase
METARVRRHVADDEPRISEMMLALDAEGAGIRATNRENIARTFAHLAEGEGRGACAVAVVGEDRAEHLAGYALVLPFWSAEYGGLLSLLDELWVEPARRSQGIGELMMRWVEAEARRRGHVAVTLLAMNHNLRAQRFYDRLGYQRLAATSFDKLLR